MYAIRIPGEVSLRGNEAVRHYARLEYASEDVLWILASAKTGLTPRIRRPPRFGRRLFARPARGARRPVACKGSPRGRRDGATSLG